MGAPAILAAAAAAAARAGPQGCRRHDRQLKGRPTGLPRAASPQLARLRLVSMAPALVRLGTIALAILAVSAGCGAGAVALLRQVPHAEVLNWTASPLVARRAGDAGVKLPAGQEVRLSAPGNGPVRGALHVEIERGFDGARCWATVNPGERIVVLARDGRIACEPVQGRLAGSSELELRSIYRGE